MEILKGLCYTKDHEWVKVEGNEAYVGISDFAQHSLGEIVYVELPQVDDEFAEGEAFGVVESVKAAFDIFLPMDGKVVEINDKLDDSPELVNEDAFGSWMVKVEMKDASQIKELMNAEQYEEFCSKEA